MKRILPLWKLLVATGCFLLFALPISQPAAAFRLVSNLLCEATESTEEESAPSSDDRNEVESGGKWTTLHVQRRGGRRYRPLPGFVRAPRRLDTFAPALTVPVCSNVHPAPGHHLLTPLRC